MAVSCPEVMYGAYYPYLYGRAGPSRSFYQYERFNQDLYSSSGVPLAASSNASGSSHSPCSPILPPSLVQSQVAAAAAASSQQLQTSASSVPTIPLSALHRHITKEEDLSATRSDNEGPISGAHNDSSCSSSPDSPHLGNQAGAGAGNSHPNSHHSNAHHQQQQQQQLHSQQQQQHQHQHSSSNAGMGLGHAHSVGSTNTGGSNQPGGGGGVQDQGGPEDSQASMGGVSRAQYVSATCVVFTHYSGDTASVVDEHFSRALNFSNKDANKVDGTNPMTARNFPASFWDSNYVPPAPAHPQMSDLYSADGSYTTDPYYGSYAAHVNAAHAYHHHNYNLAQYSNLLRLPQQYGHSSRLHHDQQTAHALESAAAYSSYPTMAGLEAQVQESSKDLYWF